MEKEKKFLPKPLMKLITIIAYGTGIFFALMIVSGYWLSSPYTMPDPTSRFISKETDGFISINFDPDDPGFSEFCTSIAVKILNTEKNSAVLMNMPSSFIQFLESNEKDENIKLFFPYEIGYLFSFKRNEEKPLKLIVVNFRYFKNFFKLFIKSLLQTKTKLIELGSENLRNPLRLFAARQDNSHGGGEDDFLTFFESDMIYLTSEKFFKTSAESYFDNIAPYYEKPEVKNFYNKLVLSENISFVADNREDSLSRFIEFETKGNISGVFFDIIDIIAGNIDIKKDDIATGIVYIDLKKMYSEKRLQEEMIKLEVLTKENFNLNIDFEFGEIKEQNYYVLKFKCTGLTKLIVDGIGKRVS
ncbi:MAG: hypothetical protein A3C43_11805 [Candidatus Schekmanbacteria bacterium RIFCSPHIGHO2_02_FULL_38_11]|uniref:Uncharacterized protein n=1 Tax=Candidatus Schekmanbacteria bacterium RIFCSPLOWO2_12_FULL_38_15 TaxID=1817883 RepID=A0A1F7SGB6_9BACT|nr:MAG: hypothetical protein A2043_10745 [Candidatus Schekmanbacteria bacterium GWA2_38_9]OGL49365.1 MAG: hypothetical protein A3H37_06775 [Candidatus Schekmanbacteria bacterium RIFCSPLOWO2_02_FULL_38_14]OGL50543.1 MAG: hypothetical protein A3C43_11805 [Candidatus Schekmanbacteria bacterium RIFCSPHIGHO2_02_FULL_38_11]OGL52843.1 MAG: hypothetical protein A3G31_00395 [Candidatus Schekmanbacteria bacterium RIFCSPLOWO2_12_FULL_38_15]